MYGVATARPEGTGFAVPIDAGAPPADRRREWMKARPRAGGPNRSNARPAALDDRGAQQGVLHREGRHRAGFWVF